MQLLNSILPHSRWHCIPRTGQQPYAYALGWVPSNGINVSGTLSNSFVTQQRGAEPGTQCRTKKVPYKQGISTFICASRRRGDSASHHGSKLNFPKACKANLQVTIENLLPSRHQSGGDWGLTNRCCGTKGSREVCAHQNRASVERGDVTVIGTGLPKDLQYPHSPLTDLIQGNHLE